MQKYYKPKKEFIFDWNKVYNDSKYWKYGIPTSAARLKLSKLFYGTRLDYIDCPIYLRIAAIVFCKEPMSRKEIAEEIGFPHNYYGDYFTALTKNKIIKYVHGYNVYMIDDNFLNGLMILLK